MRAYEEQIFINPKTSIHLEAYESGAARANWDEDNYPLDRPSQWGYGAIIDSEPETDDGPQGPDDYDPLDLPPEARGRELSLEEVRRFEVFQCT